MGCNCTKYTVSGVEYPIQNMKQCLEWVIDRAKIIVQIQERDMQVYKTNHYSLEYIYEIEPYNPNRENIIEIIKWVKE